MGKFKNLMDLDQYFENDGPEIEFEMKLSNFLYNGGEELGYTREEYPDIADFEDVLINEINLDTYKQLTFGEE